MSDKKVVDARSIKGNSREHAKEFVFAVKQEVELAKNISIGKVACEGYEIEVSPHISFDDDSAIDINISQKEIFKAAGEFFGWAEDEIINKFVKDVGLDLLLSAIGKKKVLKFLLKDDEGKL